MIDLNQCVFTYSQARLKELEGKTASHQAWGNHEDEVEEMEEEFEEDFEACSSKIIF